MIELGAEGDIQFGRGGVWEEQTKCGHQVKTMKTITQKNDVTARVMAWWNQTKCGHQVLNQDHPRGQSTTMKIITQKDDDDNVKKRIFLELPG